jgi:hypothetical protein
VGDGRTTTSDLAVIDFGTIVQGTQPVSLTKLSLCVGDLGSNLVANPYPSPITWSGFSAANSSNIANLTNGYYCWNADNNAYAQFVGGTGINGANDTISAGQGFYLVVTGTGGTFNFTESCKVSGGNTSTRPLLRQANNIGQVFKLVLQSPNDGENDETAFRIHQDATFGYDREWDMQKYFATPGYLGYPGAYTKYSTISSRDAQNFDYGIQSLPILTNTVSIPVLVKVSGPGSYTIAPQDVAQLSGCVILHDKLANVNHDLKTGSYVFTISDTTSSPRFELLLCKESNPNPNSVLEYGLTGNQVKVVKDANGTFVNTHFTSSTKAVISVYNIVGQKISEDITVEGAETSTRVNTGASNQVVFVKVTTAEAVYTRKIITE